MWQLAAKVLNNKPQESCKEWGSSSGRHGVKLKAHNLKTYLLRNITKIEFGSPKARPNVDEKMGEGSFTIRNLVVYIVCLM